MRESRRVTSAARPDPGTTATLAALDESGISRFHLKIMFVSGMGFFADAYDLFIIGIVVALLKPGWQLSTGQVSRINSATSPRWCPSRAWR